MTFTRTHDYALVRTILTHPKLWEAMSDDGVGQRDAFSVNEHPAIWYVLVHEDGALLGMFVFFPQGAVSFEAHTCLLPAAWGPRAVTAGRGVLAWMFAHSPARRIVGATPAYNRLALRLAKRCGMVEYGVNPGSFLKGGVLHDLVLTGISKL